MNLTRSLKPSLLTLVSWIEGGPDDDGDGQLTSIKLMNAAQAPITVKEDLLTREGVVAIRFMSKVQAVK